LTTSSSILAIAEGRSAHIEVAQFPAL